ncbi:putative leucine-rich repeat-containing protein DDB_G0290503 [Drosophila pseudoobscura]|uniref:Leucine-rich repeat-containing protein DDB_G0290503 n=1 Tax=Drosophila pseudoobscura pseudoobscura TaxID=46245 RepID=A0A6I8WF79_DROPS|nr:putative leucine-rich repeat-containing protein DDB_G0290503 [Drosophila pseudoobscura]
MPNKNNFNGRNQGPEQGFLKQSTTCFDDDSDDANTPQPSRLLQSFLKGHCKAVENIKRNNMEIAKKMHKKTKAFMETKAENDHLKVQLSNAEQELKELTKALEGLKGNYKQLNEKYITVLQKYTHCETHYDEEQTKIKATINQLKAEITLKQSRNDELESEVKTVQDNYLDISAQVDAMAQTNEQLTADLEKMQSQLLEHVKEKTESHNAMQNMEEQFAAQNTLHEIRISELETEIQNQTLAQADLVNRSELQVKEYNLNISHIQGQLMEKEELCRGLQQCNDTLKNQLELQRNQISAAKAENEENHRNLTTLKDYLSQVEAARDQLNASNNDLIQQNDQAAVEFAIEKTKLVKELKQQKDELEATVSRLKYELEQQNLACGELSKRNEQEVNDIHVRLSDLQGRLNESEVLCQKQELGNKQLASEHQKKTQSLQDELNDAGAKLNELTKQNQALASQLHDDEQNYKENINTLQAKLEQLQGQIDGLQQHITSLEAERDVLSNNVHQLLGEHEEMANELATAKSNFELELRSQTGILQTKLASLQMELNSKENENTELERKKDAIIAELKFKMNRIGSVFEQSVSSVRVVRPEPNPSITESQLVIEAPPAPSRKRFALNRRIEAISDSSDFLSDNELPPPKVKPQKKAISGVKRARLHKNEKDNDAAFDKLKTQD